MRTKLSVNLNKVALLRNTRDVGIPSVTEAAKWCIEAGAHGITVHPRPDERHITRQDTYDLAEVIDDVEFNIEGNPFPDYIELVNDLHPTQCTLVPDTPDQRTSDHGWNLTKDAERLAPIIDQLKIEGMRVSLFLDPDAEQVQLAKDIGADRIELYTEAYARAYTEGIADSVIDSYIEAADAAYSIGLDINAGHDLNLDNLHFFLEAIPHVAEVSIGHALIADSLLMGIHKAIESYLNALEH